MGASLARTQLSAIFDEMLRVIPDIEAGEPELLRSAFIHGIKRMPCTFTRTPDRPRTGRFGCSSTSVSRVFAGCGGILP